MNIFWENVFRYPRFLITSVTGLIVILLSPLLKLAKKNLFSRIFLVVIILLSLITLIFVLNAMLNL
ncbi:MAG: hypothetical protein CMA99_03030 [Euryarchaeota archaeon]|jgi:hypothetical protein|nr:hypothetical protein [Euryarchaeota archaeon]